MNLKKNKIIHQAQSVIEYVLLVAISIAALSIFAGVIGSLKERGGAFKEHFNTAAYYIGGINP